MFSEISKIIYKCIKINTLNFIVCSWTLSFKRNITSSFNFFSIKLLNKQPV
jgi:hypothetical protein